MSGNFIGCCTHWKLYSLFLSVIICWILDSGASDHVAGNHYLLSKLSPPKISQHITVADGSKAQVTGIGQATPLPELSLTSVLFVPSSPFNLISVSQLPRTFDCSITFTVNSFCIQDRSTGRTIGTGYEAHGLYYFESPPSVVCTTTKSPSHSSSFGSPKFK
jgi:hypothetical protein